MKLQIKDFLNTIICGDAWIELKKFPDESIDMILADPPYDKKFNLEKFIQLVMPKIKEKGSLLLFIFPDDIWKIKTPAKQICIWKEVYSPQGIETPKYRRFFDLILWYPKSKNYTFNSLMRYQLRGIFDDYFEDKLEKQHPHQKPLSLIKKLIKIHSNEDDIVLDPFLGSGTTAKAAQDLKRNYIGIEISEKYCKIAERRIKQYMN